MKMKKENTFRPDYEPQTLISIKIDSEKKNSKTQQRGFLFKLTASLNV